MQPKPRKANTAAAPDVPTADSVLLSSFSPSHRQNGSNKLHSSKLLDIESECWGSPPQLQSYDSLPLVLPPCEHSPWSSPSVRCRKTSMHQHRVQHSMQPKNLQPSSTKHQHSLLLHSLSPCLPVSPIQDCAQFLDSGSKSSLQKSSPPSKPQPQLPDDFPALIGGLASAPSPHCSNLQTYDSDVLDGPNRNPSRTLALLEDRLLRSQQIELPYSSSPQRTPQAPTTGVKSAASFETDPMLGYTSGSSSLIRSLEISSKQLGKSIMLRIQLLG